MEKYAFGHYFQKGLEAQRLSYVSFHVAILLSNNFDVSFLVSLKILLWYIPQDNCMSYLVLN